MNRIKTFHGSILDQDLVSKLGLFDVVLCLDVLEHVDDPELTINNIKKLLKNKESFAFIQFANRLHYENIVHEPHYDIPGLILLDPPQAFEYYKMCRTDNHLNYEVNRWLNLIEFEEICKQNNLLCEYYVNPDCQEATVDAIERNLGVIKIQVESYLASKEVDQTLRLSIDRAVNIYIRHITEAISSYRISKNPALLFRFCLLYAVRNYNFIIRPVS
jgi:SAM-dependent methyltransferase